MYFYATKRKTYCNVDLFYKAINSAFEFPFTISNGRTKTHQPAIVVALKLGNLMGFGEAPAISYYDITVEKMLADLEEYKTAIAKFALTDPERYWHFLHHLLPNNPFLVSALDMAAWDLWGKMEGKTLYQLWQTEWKNIPTTDYTIGIDTIENMVSKLKANPWPIYKIKLGTDRDIEIIKTLRENTDKPFRVDANAGWTLKEALEKIPELKKLGVEFVEQPLAKNAWEEMGELYAKSSLPLFADESCVFETDVPKCVDHFHGINIKLTKCSGITPAKRMIQNARQLGLKVMMGNMNETTLGCAAIANFLPQLDYVDMDGPKLLKDDIAKGLSIENGIVAPMKGAGLGIKITSL